MMCCHYLGITADMCTMHADKGHLAIGGKVHITTSHGTKPKSLMPPSKKEPKQQWVKAQPNPIAGRQEASNPNKCPKCRPS